MPKGKGKFYAVRTGRTPGIYKTWSDCEKQITKFSGAKVGEAIFNPLLLTLPQFKSFTSQDEAQRFIDSNVPETIAAAPAETVVIYTDGSSIGNGSTDAYGGIGVFFNADDPRNISEPLPATFRQTNQVAEIWALYQGLALIALDQNTEVRTDSMYCIQIFTEWIFGWIQNNWERKGAQKSIVNVEIIKKIQALLVEKKDAGGVVTFKHVSGHSGEPGNEAADSLARAGAQKAFAQ